MDRKDMKKYRLTSEIDISDVTWEQRTAGPVCTLSQVVTHWI